MNTTEYPHENDSPDWPIVREWHTSATRRVLIVHDDNAECPAMHEEGADIVWNGKASEPFWDVNSGRYSHEKPDGHAFPFRYYDTYQGSAFDLMDDDDEDEPTGWVVMDDDWTDPARAADGFIHTMNLWAQGEAYGWVVQERRPVCTCGECTEWQTVDSCWGYFGEDVLDAVRENGEAVPA